MTAATKRPPPAKSKPTPRPRPKPPAPSTGPSLRFHHSEALRRKTLSLLGTLERARDPTAHRDDLADIVVELTNCGLDAYFLKPLEVAKAGFILQQSAKLGMAGVQQVMASVIRQVVGRMEAAQLLSVCGSIRRFML